MMALWWQWPCTTALRCSRGGWGRLGAEVVVEGIGPEDHLGPAGVVRAAASVPLFEALGGEGRDLALGRDAPCGPGQVAEQGGVREHVGQAGHAGGEAGPPV